MLPSLIHYKSWDDVKDAFVKYKKFMLSTAAEVEAEFEIWKQHWHLRRESVHAPNSKDSSLTPIPDTAIAALNACQDTVFPNIFCLLKILATLPVSSCEPERVFSKVERTLTAIRASMSEERLESLILLKAHRENLPSTETVIDKFAAASARRLNLVL